jgi:hypothetical protein
MENKFLQKVKNKKLFKKKFINKKNKKISLKVIKAATQSQT